MATRRKAAPPKATEIKPGKWYALGAHDADQCCDCGLVHVVTRKLVGDRLFYKVERDDVETERVRAELGIRVLREGDE